MTVATHGTPRGGIVSAPIPKVTWAVTRDDVIDVVAIILLSVLAVVGLRSVYDGYGVHVVALVGTLGGVVAGWIIGARRLSPLTSVLVVLGAFFLGGGSATPDASIAGFVPGPGTPQALIDGLVHGWADLITTAPPVGLGGSLGTVPYVLGFVSGAGGMILARCTRQSALPALPALVAMGAGIALGTVEPFGVLVQGAGFSAVALAWGATRANRERRSIDGTIYWPRVLSAGGMLLAVLLVGSVLGPSLPFATSRDRYVVREHAIPPFDPRDYPSPLAGYRAYRTKAAKEDTFLKVQGLPKGARIRVATMDSYNGVVWIVSEESSSGSGRFERVGQRILPVPEGTQVDVTVEAAAYEGVWVPSVGVTSSVDFTGSRGTDLANAFRYNRATGTGATPIPLVNGDRFTLHATIPDQASEEDLKDVGPDRSRSVSPLTGDGADSEALKMIQELAFAKAGTGGSAYMQVVKLAEFLRTAGAYSDGGPDAKGPSKVPAGHSIARLSQFLSAEEPVGNAEQYAAAMALMAQQLGFPARVVMGFKPDSFGDVNLTGKDIDAWVEIAFEGKGWVPFDPVPDEDKQPKKKQEQQALPEELAQQEAPPPTYLDPPDDVLELAGKKSKKASEQDQAEDFKLPAIVVVLLKYLVAPVLVIVALLAAIALLKRLRMKRRRTRGTSVERVNGAWLEAVDHLRDLGYKPSPRSTRRELASSDAQVLWPSGFQFAQQVDGAMFGSTDPDETVAEALWKQADHEFAALRAPLGRVARLKASISLVSLRPRRQ